MLNRRFVPPGAVVARNAEDGGDGVTVCGTGRPAAKADRCHPLLCDARSLGKRPPIELVLDQTLGDVLRFGHEHIPPDQGLRPTCGPWPYMCSTGATWPQAICSAATPSAVASRPRCSGLGV